MTKLPLGGGNGSRRSHTLRSSGQAASPVKTRRKSAQVESLDDASKTSSQSSDPIMETRNTSSGTSKDDVLVESKDETATSQTKEPTTGGKRQRVTPRQSTNDSRQTSLGKKRGLEMNSSELVEQSQHDNVVLPHEESYTLYAREEGRDGTTMVRLILEGSFIDSPTSITSGEKPSLSHLGNDGNQFWCQVCHEFGNVVCCDGCPRVYHKECIPSNNAARTSLDRDEDPWYCPECIEDSVPTTFSALDTSSTPTALNTSEDIAIVLCKECGNKIEQLSKLESDENGEQQRDKCASCQISHESPKEENGMEDNAVSRKSRRRAPSYHNDYVKDEDYKEVDIHTENDEGEQQEKEEEKAKEENHGSRKLRKRSRADSVASEKPMDETKARTKKKPQIVKKNRVVDDQPKLSPNDEDTSQGEEDDVSFFEQENQQPDVVRATPAFFFYLAENRWKIERVLARKHRYFNRLPKGDERNELVAREAAMWWVKLRPIDHRRYMTMSMRDFEARTIEWKEEKNLREIIDVDEDSHSSDNASEPMSTTSDAREWDSNAQRFQGVHVGTKPFDLSSGEGNNRVMSELLSDLRFGKSSLVEVNRVESTTPVDEHAKSLIPYFEVHGPLSTSIGDECLGCSIGWKHYCHVLKRIIPAVEPRAKLQPPLSSLMATRVGLGLRPRTELEQNNDNGNTDSTRNQASTLVWTTSQAWKKINDLPALPSSSLGESSERFDDVAVFIEDVTLMNVDDSNVHRGCCFCCERCGALTANKAGCIDCRRAQLVINLSKKQPPGSETAGGSKTDGKSLKVQTVMLGRLQLKDGHPVTQNRSDHHVSSRILKSRWTPLAILPPHVLITPSRMRESHIGDEVDEELEVVEKLEENMSLNGYEETETIAKDLLDLHTENDTHPDINTITTPSPENRQKQERYQGRLRQPPTRLLVSSTSSKDYGGPEREKREKRKGRIDAFESRCKAVACYGILLATLRRDPLRLLAQPVDQEESYKVHPDFIHFETIKDQVLDGSYDTTDDLTIDIERMCEAVLSFCPAQSVLYKYAKDIRETLLVAASRTKVWMNALLDAFHKHLSIREQDCETEDDQIDDDFLESEPFVLLRKTWPEAIEMWEGNEELRRQIQADFMRTQENEKAYYGSLVVKRVAVAASSTLAPDPGSTNEYAVIATRDDTFDKELRSVVDKQVSFVSHIASIHQMSSRREENVVKLLRKVQKRRIERKLQVEIACCRCVGFDEISAKISHLEGKKQRGKDMNQRIDSSRYLFSTGLASSSPSETILSLQDMREKMVDREVDSCVSVRPSRIHRLGLFADQTFKKDQVVVEFVGEYIDNETIIARKRKYRENRKKESIIQVTDSHSIDATMKGGPARFINHSCLPNCTMHILKSTDDHERILFVALRDIKIHEEITYDYHLPLEVDLAARIPCNCNAKECRGFMNWNLPESTSVSKLLL